VRRDHRNIVGGVGHAPSTATTGRSAIADRPWAVVLALYVVGDSATTAVSLHWFGLVEANPLVAGLVGSVGVWALPVAKLGALAAYYLLWRALPAPYAAGVPLALATVGGVATGWNLLVMVAVV
jgi:uncharacterized membrane protein